MDYPYGCVEQTVHRFLHAVQTQAALRANGSLAPDPIEALRATGANMFQVIVYAVLPQIVPTFLSFTLYRWDINVRMSTVIGLVGGGVLGAAQRATLHPGGPRRRRTRRGSATSSVTRCISRARDGEPEWSPPTAP